MMMNEPKKDPGVARRAKACCLAALATSALLGYSTQAVAAEEARAGSPRDEFATLTALADATATRLQNLQQRYERLRQSLSPIPEASREDLLAELKKNQQLAQAAARLEGMFRELSRDYGTATSIAELEKAAAEAQARRDEWVRKQAKAESEKTPASDRPGMAVESSRDGMQPITVKLVKNRVVPLTGEYFTARGARARLAGGEVVPVRVIARVRDGEAIDDALRAGGMVDTLLSKADKRKSYLQILVCADSVAAYRLLAAHAAQRGFAYAWDTSKDEDHVQRADRPTTQDSRPDADMGVYRLPQ